MLDSIFIIKIITIIGDINYVLLIPMGLKSVKILYIYAAYQGIKKKPQYEYYQLECNL